MWSLSSLKEGAGRRLAAATELATHAAAAAQDVIAVATVDDEDDGDRLPQPPPPTDDVNAPQPPPPPPPDNFDAPPPPDDCDAPPPPPTPDGDVAASAPRARARAGRRVPAYVSVGAGSGSRGAGAGGGGGGGGAALLAAPRPGGVFGDGTGGGVAANETSVTGLVAPRPAGVFASDGGLSAGGYFGGEQGAQAAAEAAGAGLGDDGTMTAGVGSAAVDAAQTGTASSTVSATAEEPPIQTPDGAHAAPWSAPPAPPPPSGGGPGFDPSEWGEPPDDADAAFAFGGGAGGESGADGADAFAAIGAGAGNGGVASDAVHCRANGEVVAEAAVFGASEPPPAVDDAGDDRFLGSEPADQPIDGGEACATESTFAAFPVESEHGHAEASMVEKNPFAASGAKSDTSAHALPGSEATESAHVPAEATEDGSTTQLDFGFPGAGDSASDPFAAIGANADASLGEPVGGEVVESTSAPSVPNGDALDADQGSGSPCDDGKDPFAATEADIDPSLHVTPGGNSPVSIPESPASAGDASPAQPGGGFAGTGDSEGDRFAAGVVAAGVSLNASRDGHAPEATLARTEATSDASLAQPDYGFAGAGDSEIDPFAAIESNLARSQVESSSNEASEPPAVRTESSAPSNSSAGFGANEDVLSADKAREGPSGQSPLDAFADEQFVIQGDDPFAAIAADNSACVRGDNAFAESAHEMQPDPFAAMVTDTSSLSGEGNRVTEGKSETHVSASHSGTVGYDPHISNPDVSSLPAIPATCPAPPRDRYEVAEESASHVVSRSPGDAFEDIAETESQGVGSGDDRRPSFAVGTPTAFPNESGDDIKSVGASNFTPDVACDVSGEQSFAPFQFSGKEKESAEPHVQESVFNEFAPQESFEPSSFSNGSFSVGFRREFEAEAGSFSAMADPTSSAKFVYSGEAISHGITDGGESFAPRGSSPSPGDNAVPSVVANSAQAANNYGSTSPEVDAARQERDRALVSLAEVQTGSNANAERAERLEGECMALRAKLADAEEEHDVIARKYCEQLASVEEKSRAAFHRAAESLRVAPLDEGANATSASEVEELRRALEVERQRAAASEEFAASSKKLLVKTMGERDVLLNEKRNWVAKEMALSEKESSASSKLVDVECRLTSTTAERNSAAERCETLAAQMKGLSAQLGSALQERDKAMSYQTPGRSPALADMESDRERIALSLSTVQKQLAGAMAKIDKLSGQRRKYQQQRDDAGARLRAAGAEFQVIQDKLGSAVSERDSALASMSKALKERDELQVRLGDTSHQVVLLDGLKGEVSDLRSKLSLAESASRESSSSLAELSRLQEQLASCECSLAEANARAEMSAEEAALARRAGDKCASELVGKVGELGILQSSLNASEASRASLEAQLVSLRTDMSQDSLSASANIERMQTEIGHMKGTVDSLQMENKAHRDANEAARLELLEAMRRFGGAGGADGVSPSSDLRVVCTRTAACIDASGLQSQQLRAEASQFASRVEDLEGRLGELQNECDALEGALSAAEMESKRVVDSTVDKREFEASVKERDSAMSDLDATWDLVSMYAPQQSSGWMSLPGRLGNSQSNKRDVVAAVQAVVTNLEQKCEEHEHRQAEIEALGASLAEVQMLHDSSQEEIERSREASENVAKEIAVERERAKVQIRAEYAQESSDLQDDLRAAEAQVSAATKTQARLAAEAEQLRDLNAKLTSEFNGRTNELDDAEEKVAYLQDQVATLEEELEDFRRSSQSRVEETDEAWRNEKERLTDELVRQQDLVEDLRESNKALAARFDSLEVSEREASLLADTHRLAEKNLQIAIEQMEAERETELARRTADLERQLESAQKGGAGIPGLQEEAASAAQKIEELNAEILEQRAALGRLADERVELKLELEEKLSRLNHPDAGGQLVDRRVVRQLLVSYFRVDSLRRQDVMELMSRMLAFSEDDLVAVGLKRRALMERLGSVVRPPDPDHDYPLPVGTVSEKWIEFLINASDNTEETDDF